MPTSPLRILSIIPPMTQLNTPYPSTAYLTGFLRSRGIEATQDDIALKLVLLLCTALIAAHARLRVIPRLSADTLPLMAWHVGAVTLLSVGFVAVGVSLRFGGV